MDLRELYQGVILDHGRKPRNFHKLIQATHSHEGRNPLCGDQLVIYIKAENNRIIDISFEGSGCAISVASASLLTEIVKGISFTEAKILFDRIHELLTKGKLDNNEQEKELNKLIVFKGVAEYPARVKCASLAWHTLLAALNGEGELITTE